MAKEKPKDEGKAEEAKPVKREWLEAKKKAAKK